MFGYTIYTGYVDDNNAMKIDNGIGKQRTIFRKVKVDINLRVAGNKQTVSNGYESLSISKATRT